jgi:exonuclease SbcC
MPSRSPGEAPGGFSYYEHLCQPEAVKELVWEHDGQRYRSELVFRVNGRRRTDAFLHVDRGGKWVPVRLPDGTVADGKADTYDACLQHVLGTAETFFASQFAAQNRRALSDYRPGEIKTLLSDMLGLESIRASGQGAAETATLLKSGLFALRSEQQAIRGECDELRVRRARLGEVGGQLARAVQERTAARAAAEVARQALAQLQAAQQVQGDTEERRRTLLQQKTKVGEEGERQARALQAQAQRENGRVSRIDRAIEERRQRGRRQLEELGAESERLKAVAALGARVLRAVQRQRPREQVVAAREVLSQACEAAVAGAIERVGRLRTLENDIAAIEREAGQATLRIEDLKRRLRLADEVPCAGTELQGRCRLLQEANAAKALMPSAQDAVGGLAIRRAQMKAGALQLANAPREAQVAEAALKQARRRLKRSELAAKDTALLSARIEEVRQAETMLARLSLDIAQLKASMDAGATEMEEAERKEATEALGRIEREREDMAQRHGDAVAEIDRALKSLPPAFDARRLQSAQSSFEQLERRLATADTGHESAVQLRQHALDLEGQLQEQHGRRAAIDARIRTIEDELAGWTLLARALGNDGVIALSIDDAGPTLAGLANDLLLACYGPRFTVAIRTQVATAKGELREGFDVVVNDGESGESKSVSVMSGGERVWINECLTRAIALYLAQNAGRRYGTLFSDEADGPLDPQRKRMFMAMKREVLRLGGYRREFFVSQTPELTAMADAVIDAAALRAKAQACTP